MISRTFFVLFVMIGHKAKRAQMSAAAEVESAICVHRIERAPSSAIRRVRIGEQIKHRWSCAEEYGPNRYSLFVRNCGQIERNGQRTVLTDKFGCAPPNSSAAVAGRLSLNNSFSSSQHNANRSAAFLTVSAYSLLNSFPFGGFFRIECTLSLLPKVLNVTEFPNCFQHLTDRERTLNKLLTPTMANQKRFIDMVETNVSSDWIEVESEQSNERKLDIGTKQRRPFGIRHDQMPISGESEEVPAMALSPFLEHAYSIFATSLLSSTPPTFASPSLEIAETQSVIPPVAMPSSTDSLTVSAVIGMNTTTVSNLSANSNGLINPKTVTNVEPSAANETATSAFNPMESQTVSSLFAPIGIRPAESLFQHLPTKGTFSQKEAAKEEKKEDNSFAGSAFAEKMEEIIRGFVPLIVRQNSTNSSVHSNSNSALFHNLSARQCSWTMLNTALLVWSIFSTLHWLCLLAAKLRSSVAVRRRLNISPKQKMAVAKMSAMKRKMMGPKRHCGGIKHRRNIIEYPNTSIISEWNSPAGKRRAQQKALRTVRQRHLLHRTMVGEGMAPMGRTAQGKTKQNDQKEKLPFSVLSNRGGQKPKSAHSRRLVTKLGRICEEEEEEGKGENHRQKLVIGGGSSEEMTDGSDEKAKSVKLAEKTAFWDGWAHGERQNRQMAERGRQNRTTEERMFKFF